MMVEIFQGDGVAPVTLAGVEKVEELGVKRVDRAGAGGDLVAEALDHPIGIGADWAETVAGRGEIVIVVSDSFRQTRVEQVLPVLLDRLTGAGARDEAISFVFATGVHRPPTAEEQAAILGDGVFERFRGRLYSHDPWDAGNLVHVGTTRRGTPVEINRRVHESASVIVTGAVVLHYFGGFGGGRKSIVPGVASARTIAHNHAMNLSPVEDVLDPSVRIGVLGGNPVAEDMLEGAQLSHVEFLVNTVLDPDGEIAGVFAGDLARAHEAACSLARELYVCPVDEPADLVIAVAGHTRNFVQTHKALYNAYQAVKPGGRIVLVAPCPEGLGGEAFVKWLRLGNRETIFRELRRQSEINGQTALSTLEKMPITTLVTEMPAADVGLLGGRKAGSIQEACDAALTELRAGGVDHPSCYVMPHAAYTVPAAGAGLLGAGGG